MATITSRGTGTHNSGTATLVCAPTSTLAVGSLGILAVSADNAGSGGATLMGPASVTDSVGNVWTLRRDSVYDPGAASAGIELLIYTARIVVALTSGGSVTLTWVAGVLPVAKVWTFTEIAPGAGNSIVYVTGADGVGSATGTPTITTSSIPIGDITFGCSACESPNTYTGDADTTNGSWTAVQTTSIGSTTSGVAIGTQAKIQTTAGSAQTFNPTHTSSDTTIAWIQLSEIAQITATPPTKAVVLATFAPAARAPRLVTPPVTAIVAAAFAPVVSRTQRQLITPSTTALALATFAPTARAPRLATPPVKTVALATFAPAIAAPRLATPPTKPLVTSAFAPAVTASDRKTVTPPTKALATSSFAPVVAVPRLATPPVKALAIAALAPTVAATANRTAVPAIATLATASFAPVVATPRLVTPATKAAALTSFAPIAAAPRVATPGVLPVATARFAPTVATPRVVTPAVAALATTRPVPVVTASANRTVVPDVLSMAATAFAPTTVASDRQVVTPPVRATALAAFAPIVAVGDARSFVPTPVSLAMTAFAPGVVATDTRIVVPGRVSLAITTRVPTARTPVAVVPGPLQLALAPFLAGVTVRNLDAGTPLPDDTTVAVDSTDLAALFIPVAGFAASAERVPGPTAELLLP